MTPEPSPTWGSCCWPGWPKKKRNQGSWLCAEFPRRLGALLAVTLTTAGEARLAAAARGCKGSATPLAATLSCGEVGAAHGVEGGITHPVGAPDSHWGLKVPRTNRTATATVTAWEKISQVLRMRF